MLLSAQKNCLHNLSYDQVYYISQTIFCHYHCPKTKEDSKHYPLSAIRRYSEEPFIRYIFSYCISGTFSKLNLGSFGSRTQHVPQDEDKVRGTGFWVTLPKSFILRLKRFESNCEWNVMRYIIFRWPVRIRPEHLRA